MKKVIVILAGLAAMSLTSCHKKSDANLKSFSKGVDSAAYMVGYLQGDQFAERLKTFPGDSVDNEVFLSGFTAGIRHLSSKMSKEEMNTYLQSYFEKMHEKEVQKLKKEGEENKKAQEKFLQENKTKDGVVTTETGLQYKVEKEGTGLQPTSPKDTVVVNYKGTLLDGQQFDSSYDRKEPATFPLNGVIPGWTEVLMKMKAGAKLTAWIPSDLAYGENGAGAKIGPNSLLRFDMELLQVKPCKETSKK